MWVTHKHPVLKNFKKKETSGDLEWSTVGNSVTSAAEQLGSLEDRVSRTHKGIANNEDDSLGLKAKRELEQARKASRGSLRGQL